MSSTLLLTLLFHIVAGKTTVRGLKYSTTSIHVAMFIMNDLINISQILHTPLDVYMKWILCHQHVD